MTVINPEATQPPSRVRVAAYHPCMLSVAEAADRLGRDVETVQRWIRSGRLPAHRRGAEHAIDDRDLRALEDELFPMSELPAEWRTGDDGTPAPNWVAVLHRSRSGH